MSPRMLDVHSHMTTKEGYLLQDRSKIEALEKYYKAPMPYKTEEEMYQDFKAANVKAIISPSVSTTGYTLEWLVNLHNYTDKLVKKHPDVYQGAWCLCDPTIGREGVEELERCLDLGMIGPYFLPGVHRLHANESAYYPYYEVASKRGVPVLIAVGMTGLGAGQPGGWGVPLEYFKPFPGVDGVAADFADLKIIASHPAWPWDAEMISILLHKSNVYQDLHGWAPKYIDPGVIKDLNGRLQDKFVTGVDYPTFSHDRIIKDWDSMNLKPAVIEKLLYKNLMGVLGIDKL